MNNQYNPQQQPTPQQSTPQQTAPQQTAPQQAPMQQPQQQYGGQPGFQQPNVQQPVYQRPPKPYVDPAVANKQKQDAVNAFGDKLTDLLNTNPILKIIAKYADIISYAATGLCVFFTIIAMISCNVRLYGSTVLNLGGEIGGCFIFPILAVIFGGLSLCKKQMLPLTASLTAVSALMFTRFIVSIVTFATIGDIGSLFSGSGSSVPGGIVISFLFLIIEMGCVGFLTYLCWTYFLATLPPKPVMQQTYYPQRDNMQQQAAYQQPTVPQQPQAPATQAVPVQAPAAQTAPQQAPAAQVAPQPASVSAQAANRVCPNCQTVNAADSSFCQKCGTRLG